MSFSLVLSVLCLIGLAAGQSIMASPSNRIAVGGSLNITCNSGDDSAPPDLLINGRSTANTQQVDNITPVGADNRLAIFRFSSVAKANDSITFTCTNLPGALSIILDVLFMPEIYFDNQTLMVNAGESAPISFNVDANPAVTAENITVTVGGQSVGFDTSFNGTMVTIMLLNLRVSGQYQVEATNIVGMDSIAFQVNVISASSTMVTQSTTSSITEVSSSSSQSDSSSSSMTPSSTMATPGATAGPTGPSSATGVQASTCFVLLLLVLVVFMI